MVQDHKVLMVQYHMDLDHRSRPKSPEGGFLLVIDSSEARLLRSLCFLYSHRIIAGRALARILKLPVISERVPVKKVHDAAGVT